MANELLRANGIIEDEAACVLREGAKVQTALTVSLAISLKRIADTLDTVVVGTAEDNRNAVRVYQSEVSA